LDIHTHPAAVAEAARHPMPGGLSPIDSETVERAVALVKEGRPRLWRRVLMGLVITSLPFSVLSIDASHNPQLAFRKYALLIVTTSTAIGAWRPTVTCLKERKAHRIAQAIVDAYLQCLRAAVGACEAAAAEAQWRQEHGL